MKATSYIHKEIVHFCFILVLYMNINDKFWNSDGSYWRFYGYELFEWNKNIITEAYRFLASRLKL